MSQILVRMILSAYGRLYMYLRYRNEEVKVKVLSEEYDNSYTDVGRTHILYLIIGLMLIATGGLVIGTIFGQIYKTIK